MSQSCPTYGLRLSLGRFSRIKTGGFWVVWRRSRDTLTHSQSFGLRMGFPKGCSDDQVSCGPVHVSQGGERSVVVELFHLFDGSRGMVGPTVQDCAVLKRRGSLLEPKVLTPPNLGRLICHNRHTPSPKPWWLGPLYQVLSIRSKERERLSRQKLA